jgi:hypothetical protein
VRSAVAQPTLTYELLGGGMSLKNISHSLKRRLTADGWCHPYDIVDLVHQRLIYPNATKMTIVELVHRKLSLSETGIRTDYRLEINAIRTIQTSASQTDTLAMTTLRTTLRTPWRPIRPRLAREDS